MGQHELSASRGLYMSRNMSRASANLPAHPDQSMFFRVQICKVTLVAILK
jgi:hypothetical protein